MEQSSGKAVRIGSNRDAMALRHTSPFMIGGAPPAGDRRDHLVITLSCACHGHFMLVRCPDRPVEPDVQWNTGDAMEIDLGLAPIVLDPTYRRHLRPIPSQTDSPADAKRHDRIQRVVSRMS
jgi:hypothetical protein